LGGGREGIMDEIFWGEEGTPLWMRRGRMGLLDGMMVVFTQQNGFFCGKWKDWKGRETTIMG
jgi:hypothetical protein